MQFIDTHLHLQDYKTGFATDIVKEALTGGVDRLVCAATGMFDWDKVARFAKQYPGTVVPAFGLHRGTCRRPNRTGCRVCANIWPAFRKR